MTYRILVVDDHPVLRRGLREMLKQESELEICGEAEDAATALERLASLRPDLMLVDVSLGGSSGIELIKRIRAVDKEVKILVLSVHDEAVYGERALRAGAQGYVNKREPTEKLIESMRRVLRGDVSLSRGMTSRVLHLMIGGQGIEQDPIERLSDRELEVFRLIGQGSSTSGIAAELHLSVKTVESYRENIKTKLALRSGAELTHRAVQWVMEEDRGGADG